MWCTVHKKACFRALWSLAVTICYIAYMISLFSFKLTPFAAKFMFLYVVHWINIRTQRFPYPYIACFYQHVPSSDVRILTNSPPSACIDQGSRIQIRFWFQTLLSSKFRSVSLVNSSVSSFSFDFGFSVYKYIHIFYYIAQKEHNMNM